MDTISQEEPVGSDDVTSSPDTSTQDTQPEETSGTFDGENGAESGEAPLLAGKYKTPQDLEDAYKSLEGKLGELGQKAKVADLLQRNYGMNPDQVEAQIAQMEQQQAQERMQNDPAGYALQEVQTLKGQIAVQAEEKILDSFIKDNPEYTDFRDKIFDIGLNLKKDMTYGEIAKDYFGQAIASGQQGAYKKIDTKKMTQTTGTQSAPQKKFTDADLENMSSKEMETFLGTADTSHRPY